MTAGCALMSTRPSIPPRPPAMRAGLALSLIALVLPLATTARADPLADFYRGRNVTLIIGYSAGGGYDAYARVVARHLAGTFRAIRRSLRRTCPAPAACGPPIFPRPGHGAADRHQRDPVRCAQIHLARQRYRRGQHLCDLARVAGEDLERHADYALHRRRQRLGFRPRYFRGGDQERVRRQAQACFRLSRKRRSGAGARARPKPPPL